jgi:hypothetical protein
MMIRRMEMKMVSFKVNKADKRLIDKIVERALIMAKANDIEYDRMDAAMDITATHANGCPLKLQKLLAADDFNFAHDVFGIRRHLNRETGQLENHFLPRCAA